MDGQMPAPGHSRQDVALSLRSFALRVVSDIARSSGSSVGRGSGTNPELVHALIGYARTGDQALLSGLYAQLKSKRITAEDVLDRYVPCAVGEVGQQWHDEEIDILQASMACARMQNMLRELGYAQMSDLSGRADDGRVLLTLPAAEQHTLGMMLAANQLRRRGVSVKIMIQPSLTQLRAYLEKSFSHAVFISVSNRSSLAPCADMVRAVRDVTKDRVPIVVGGGLVSAVLADNTPRLIARMTGAEIVTNDIAQALHYSGIQQVAAAE